MTYHAIIKLPDDIINDSNTEKITKHQEEINQIELGDLVDLYTHYLASGYSISVSFNTDEAEESIDAFGIAHNLDSVGISYTATLGLKDKGSYDYMIQAAKDIESRGFDYDVNIKLKINSESPVNIDKESSWFAPQDAEYSIGSSLKTKTIEDFSDLYEALTDHGFNPKISIRPKPIKTGDDFAAQVSNFPNGTKVTLRLKNTEY